MGYVQIYFAFWFNLFKENFKKFPYFLLIHAGRNTGHRFDGQVFKFEQYIFQAVTIIETTLPIVYFRFGRQEHINSVVFSPILTIKINHCFLHKSDNSTIKTPASITAFFILVISEKRYEDFAGHGGLIFFDYFK